VNPRIGSGLQQGREVAEEQTVEVVRNHEGGTPDGNWPSHLEGGAGRSDADGVSGSADSTIRTMEGRSLDNPTRGNPALRPGRKDRNASGKSAPRSGGSREPAFKRRRANRSKVLEDQSAFSAPRSRRAAVNGQGAAASIGTSPPAGGTCRCGGVARTTPRRKTRGIGRRADRRENGGSPSPAA
jgi:hypothetical protein